MLLRSFVLLASITSTPAVQLPPPPGTIAVVDFTGRGATFVDRDPAGEMPAPVGAGTHTVTAAEMKADVTVGSGCSATVVAYYPHGPDRRAELLTATECPIPRMAAPHASIRFALAVAPASVPDGLDLVVGAQTLHAAAGTFSGRVEVPPDDAAELVVGTQGMPLRSVRAQLEAGHAYTVLFGGGGETSPRLVVMDDGAQASAAPAPGVRIETGTANSSSKWPPFALDALGVLAGIAVLGALTSPRHRVVIIAILSALALGACQAGPEEAARENGARRATLPAKPSTHNMPPSVGLTGSTDAEKAATAPAALHIGTATATVIPLDPHANVLKALRDPFVGWYTEAEAPAAGNVVLIGHSRWGDSVGVFRELVSLAAGTELTVVDHTGSERTYRVDGALVRSKADPWTAAFAPTANPGLVLVTCVGPLDESTGLHANNLWIHASART